MNLAAILQWASNVLRVLREPPAVVRERVRPERLQEKLGWLQEFAAEVVEWSEWQKVMDVTVTFVNRNGVFRGAAAQVRAELGRYSTHASSLLLAKELVAFMAEQGRQTRPGERFPGSTEVLESCFGRFKQLEKQQARGGFTSLLLGFGALLADTTTTAIKQAMNHSPTNKIYTWCKDYLGTTLLGQRKLAFASGATKIG
jgi:hypothetical protein